MKLSDFNDRHLGETIYIIGCAPTLNQLTDQEIAFLNKSITLGVNFSHLKIDLTYWIGGHIEQTVFALESRMPHNVPLFAHRDKRLEYVKEVWQNPRIVSVDDINPQLPLSRHADEKQNLYGTTSIMLSATHLAYIMGASKIIYLGFEGKNALHFYTQDEASQRQVIRDIKQIMLKGVYSSDTNYNLPQMGVNPFLNVHRAFEYMMNPAVPNCHFAPVDVLEARPLNYFDQNSPNRAVTHSYVTFLQEQGLQMLTLSREEMAVDAGCDIKEDLTNPECEE